MSAFLSTVDISQMSPALLLEFTARMQDFASKGLEAEKKVQEKREKEEEEEQKKREAVKAQENEKKKGKSRRDNQGQNGLEAGKLKNAERPRPRPRKRPAPIVDSSSDSTEKSNEIECVNTPPPAAKKARHGATAEAKTDAKGV